MQLEFKTNWKQELEYFQDPLWLLTCFVLGELYRFSLSKTSMSMDPETRQQIPFKSYFFSY